LSLLDVVNQVPPILAFAVAFFLAILVLYRNYRKANYRLFAVYLAGMGLWGLFIFALRASPDTAHAKVWAQTIAPSGILTSATFLHFSILHTRLKVKPWMLAVIYGLFVVVFFMSIAGLLVEDVIIDAWGYLPIYSSLNQFTAAISYVFLILGIVNFIRAYRRSNTYEERNSYIYILVGIFFAMAGGIVDYTSTLSTTVPPIGLIGNVIFGALATIAVLRFHLLDIRIIVRKGVAYLLTSTTVGIIYVGLIVLFSTILQQSLPQWAHIFLLLAAALVLQALWRGVQQKVDRWFYRDQYDFLNELEKFSQESHDISNLPELSSSLVGLVARGFQVPSVYLLLLQKTGVFNPIATTEKVGSHISISKSSPIIEWLNNNKGVLPRLQLELDPKLQAITMKEKTDITHLDIHMFVPLKSNQGEVIGLLLMGQKKSEQPYSDEDLRRIITVTSRISIELENARLYAQELSVRKELQRQDEQKTEFLHHVAHELKTPLTAIISSSELMTAEDIVNIPLEQRERLLNNINRSAWLMDRKVGELLDLARIQIGRLEMNLTPLDMGEIIEDLTSQLSSLFKNKEQSLEIVIPITLPQAKGDRERTTEVILNLLSNANKFSPAGGHITILAKADDSMITLEVKDSAPTISEVDRERIFNAYYRGGSNEEQQRVSGLGLGLAISKRLVELQGGEIGVICKEGQGNIFYFTLPIWREMEQNPEDRSNQGEAE